MSEKFFIAKPTATGETFNHFTMKMPTTRVTITPKDNGNLVQYWIEDETDSYCFRWYETEETIAEIREYVRDTYGHENVEIQNGRFTLTGCTLADLGARGSSNPHDDRFWDWTWHHIPYVITYDAATDLLNCTCGNTTHTDGFVAVDENGLECEPYEGWGNRYMCQNCGAKITLEVKQ